jgi:hypothetical protein
VVGDRSLIDPIRTIHLEVYDLTEDNLVLMIDNSRETDWRIEEILTPSIITIRELRFITSKHICEIGFIMDEVGFKFDLNIG